MAMDKTLERKTADAILEHKQHITLGGVRYSVAQPTLATLIEVSALVAEMPEIVLRPTDIVGDVLREAHKCKALADIAATMIVGVSNHWLWRHTRRIRRAIIARRLLDVDIVELNAAIGALMRGMHTEDFFVCASFLISINMTKATREEATTTAFGR
jgi:hypothetical protein